MGQKNRKRQRNRANPAQILQGQLERRTAAAMKQNEAFAQEHWRDSREDVLVYVRQRAEELGRSPLPAEVPGSAFIASYFPGGWAHVLRSAGLPPLPVEYLGSMKDTRAAEFQRQRQLYRWRKAEKQARQEALQKVKRETKKAPPPAGARRKRTPEQQRKAEEKALLLEADAAWGREHAADTDEQLLEHLRRCAGSLPEGQAPQRSQVLGGYYIAKRFGKWPMALFLAGLPLPGGCDPISQEDLEAYRRRRDARDAARRHDPDD